MKLRDTFHASLGIDLTIQLFLFSVFNCLEQRGVGFLNKGCLKEVTNRMLLEPLLFRHPVYMCTFLHFPCTHASKERCKKHLVGIWVVHCCALSLFLLDFEASLGNAALFSVDLEVAGKR